jgi:hypothetical protein
MKRVLLWLLCFFVGVSFSTSGVQKVAARNLIIFAQQQTASAAGTFFETDWTSAGSADEVCSTTPCPDTWDTSNESGSSSAVTGSAFVHTHNAADDYSTVWLDDDASEVLENYTATEVWFEWTFEIDQPLEVKASSAIGGLRVDIGAEANKDIVRYRSDASGDVYNILAGFIHDAGYTSGGCDFAFAPSASTEYTIRGHLRQDSDGGADVGGDNGLWEVSVVGGNSCQNTSIDNDASYILDKVKFGIVANFWDTVTTITITLDDFKMYIVDPGW